MFSENVCVIVHKVGDGHGPWRAPVTVFVKDRVEGVGVDGPFAFLDDIGEVQELVGLDKGGQRARSGIGLQEIGHSATGKGGLGGLLVGQAGETAVSDVDARVGVVEAFDDFVHRAQPGNGRHLGPHFKFGDHLFGFVRPHVAGVGRRGYGGASGQQANTCRA